MNQNYIGEVNALSFDNMSSSQCNGETGVAGASAADDIRKLFEMVAHLQQAVSEQNEKINNLRHVVSDRDNKIHDLQERLAHLERWEFLHPQVPFKYWIDHGLSAESIEAMCEFLREMKRKTYKMRNDGDHNNGCVRICPPREIDFIHSLVIGDCDVLPYWKELADAMLCHGFMDCVGTRGDSRFELSKIELGKEMMDLLAPAVKANAFKRIQMTDNRSGRASVLFLMDYIESNHELECIDFENNRLEADDIGRLCHLIEYHPSLQHLVVRDCGGDEPSTLLFPLITTNSRLESIDLTGNNICSDGGTALLDFIADNTSLRTLRLNNNHFNDHDAIMMAAALENNTTLRKLDLGRFRDSNDCHELGREAFFQAVFDTESLNSVAGCNHTCHVIHPGADPQVPAINGKYSPNLVRRMKLLALLSAPYEDAVNVNYLNDTPPRLMPLVFALVQRYPEVRSEDPDMLDDEEHWYWMAQLRPETHQRAYSEYAHVEPAQVADEYDPRPAQIKRLTMTFEIMRGSAFLFE